LAVVQITSYGLKTYTNAIGSTFGDDVDFAQLVKIYGKPPRPPQKWHNRSRYADVRPPRRAALINFHSSQACHFGLGAGGRTPMLGQHRDDDVARMSSSVTPRASISTSRHWRIGSAPAPAHWRR
jgi:hypothetical protein